MMFFSDEQRALMAKTRVRIATLVELQFATVARYWNGNQNLTINGQLYYGTGHLGRIEGLLDSRTTNANQINLILSGTDTQTNRIVMSTAAEQEGKFCYVSFQLFDPDWQTVGAPIRVFTGLTQPITASRQSGAEGEGAIRSLTLPVENFFYGRSRPPASLYTSTDQRSRFPGDAFLDYQHKMARGVSYVFP
jgi:hypothetical protein